MKTSARSAARRSVLVALGAVALAASGGLAWPAPATPGKGLVPVTTSSAEARDLYLKGRDLAERLRLTDARGLYEQALARDPGFALAHYGAATTASSAKQFFDEASRAAALAGKVSEGERLMIQALEAQAKGLPAAQRASLERLVQLHPEDARAHNLLGTFLFGQQDYQGAVAEFQKATALDASFSQPYNWLGYSHRFLGRYPEAERAFKAYVALLPKDPNPHDSYAELLMKMGRFQDSIASYRRALAVDPSFLASYFGIGNDQIFLGRGAEARETFAKARSLGRNDGERRLAMFWTAMSWLHEGDHHRALAEIETMHAIAEVNGDKATMAGDLNLIGNVLLEAGRPDAAQRRYAERLKVMEEAAVPLEVKEATRRNTLFNEARVAIARKDLPAARAKAAEFARQVAVKANPFEVRQQHEVEGRIALAAGDAARALATKDGARPLAELSQANQQDPQVLFLVAQALEARGDAVAAREAYRKVADFNAFFPTYAFVRAKAKAALAKS